MPNDSRITQDGMIFGEAQFLEHAHVSLFAVGPESLAPTFLIQQFNHTFRARMKIGELRNLRDAIDKAIRWMEDKDVRGR